MRTKTGIAFIALVPLAHATVVDAQLVTDPLPRPVEKRGLEIGIRDVVRLPQTRGTLPPEEDVNPSGWARVSFVRDIADGRRFANDSRGLLYLLEGSGGGNGSGGGGNGGGEPHVYLDIRPLFPHALYNRLESGLIGFDFHPDFARNGLFYTVHGERAPGNPATPDFVPPEFTAADVTYHNVITEWRANDPEARTFEGTRRELLRVAHIVQNMSHPFGYVGFNPTAERGDEDYGLLYTSGSDLGFSNGGGPHANNPGQTQRLDSVVGAILRIDPRSPAESGGEKGLGDYTIPAGNHFAADGDAETLGEIYAYGFRNAHRLSWDLDDGTLFAADIGMNHIEEINIVENGGNYGWMRREGYWENGMPRPGGALDHLYALPADVLDGTSEDAFVYPVAIYDHSDGQAVSGGFTYHGEIEALRGKFVFGDIARGRLFAADTAALKAADDGIPRTVAPVEEIQLVVRNSDGERVRTSFRELVERTNGATAARADLHLGRSADGEIFVTSRQDGMIRMLAAAAEPSRAQDLEALAARVRVLEDREDIRALIQAYGKAHDNRDYESFAALFAEEDGEWVGGMGSAKGRERIFELMDESIGHDPQPEGSGTYHLLTNDQIEIDGDLASAVTKWVYVTPGEDGSPRMVFLGHYNDRFIRENGEWKFLRREAPVDIPVQE